MQFLSAYFPVLSRNGRDRNQTGSRFSDQKSPVDIKDDGARKEVPGRGAGVFVGPLMMV